MSLGDGGQAELTNDDDSNPYSFLVKCFLVKLQVAYLELAAAVGSR